MMKTTFAARNTFPSFKDALFASESQFAQLRRFSRGVAIHSPPNIDFGILFDIDGVLARGREVLPNAPLAFKKLIDGAGNFKIPTIFVTNAGNQMRKLKAERLSEWLNCEIDENQVVMSHSPLKMYHDFHQKNVLISGQGPILDIANNLGFQKVVTMEQLRQSYPTFDAIDSSRRFETPRGKVEMPIEGIILFGEPTRWETSLQLIIDVLIMNGDLNKISDDRSTQHPQHFKQLPILACNMDLQWMAEAPLPRFGHGAFLCSLENLYKKITGRELVYNALLGKPSEVTYIHGEHLLQQQASEMGVASPLRNMYCIGDNVCTDIVGANLYDTYVKQRRDAIKDHSKTFTTEKQLNLLKPRDVYSFNGRQSLPDRIITHLNRCNDLKMLNKLDTNDFCGSLYDGIHNCYSIQVETGVHTTTTTTTHCTESSSSNRTTSSTSTCSIYQHSPRDFLTIDDILFNPTFIVDDVLDAINLIFEKHEIM